MNEILIVEDSTADAKAAVRALKKAGVKNPVKWIDHGTRAMKYLEAVPVPPTVVFLDVKLPGYNGFELLDYVRENPKFNRTLRIVFSSMDDIQTIKHAYAGGAHSFLTKPVPEGEIADLVKAFAGHWVMKDGSAERSLA
jgi:CheY-like chemotaxis protein